MRDFVPFTCDAEIEAIYRGLIDRSLPKSKWTHAAHFASALWLLNTRSYEDAARELPGMIWAYNEATGTANTDSGGYHETITRASLRAALRFLEDGPPRPVFAACNALMASRLGDSSWLLEYWSRERLFSVAARRGWVEPDLRELPF